jgi:hypothetical protein
MRSKTTITVLRETTRDGMINDQKWKIGTESREEERRGRRCCNIRVSSISEKLMWSS